MTRQIINRVGANLVFLAVLLLILVGTGAAAEEQTEILKQWPEWRGPLRTGVAPHGDPPVVWAEDKNVGWKLSIPGTGHSTPIIWGNRIFLTTAVPFGEVQAHAGGHVDGAHDNMEPTRAMKFIVLAVDRRSGKILWEKTVRGQRPHEGTHETGSWASNSSATDGEHLFAYFGSQGLYSLDLSGKVVWERDLGDMQIRHAHGEGSSVALHEDTLVANWDHQNESFLVALDKRTGEEKWKVGRDEITSWSTPLVVKSGGKAQVVVAATGRVRGYDLETGMVIWECGGLSRNVVASPVASGNLVIVANSYDWQAMMAIRLDKAQGDITHTSAIAWNRHRDTPYVPSPLLYDDMLFFLKHSQGFLTNVDVKTGEPFFGPERLRGFQMIFASPVGAGGRVYIVGRSGLTLVLKKGKTLEILARNRLEDSFSASPAVVGKELYLRGEKSLYQLVETTTSSTHRADSPASGAGPRRD